MNDTTFTNVIKAKASDNASLVNDLITDMQAMIAKLQAVKAEYESAASTGNASMFDGACQSMRGIYNSSELNGSWRTTALDASHDNI